MTSNGIEFSQTDLGNAKLLAHLHGDDLRWCPEAGKWYVWSGHVWESETPGAGAVQRRWQNCLERIELGGDTAWAIKSSNAGRVRAAIDMAKGLSGMQLSPGQMDANPYILNTPTGIVDLRTGEVSKPERLEYCTRSTAVGIAPDDRLSPDSEFGKFLSQTCVGRHDLMDALLRWLGYCLTGVTHEQKFALAVGVGRNGKSTLMRLVMSLLGDGYAAPLPSQLLLSSKIERPAHELERLGGVRFAVAEEPDHGRTLDREYMKALSSGEPQRVCAKYGHPYTMVPVLKLVLATNDKPAVRWDEAFKRRVVVFPFDHVVPDGEIEKYLLDRLLSEGEAILRTLVRGSVRHFKEGLLVTDAMTDARDSYEEDNDYLAQFMESHCVLGEDEYVHPEQFTKAYNRWAEANGYSKSQHRELKVWMARKGFRTQPKGHKKLFCFAGIGLDDGEPRSEYLDKLAGLD